LTAGMSGHAEVYPHKVLIPVGAYPGSPFSAWFNWTLGVYTSFGISTGSSVFAGITRIRNETQTTKPVTSVAIGRI